MIGRELIPRRFVTAAAAAAALACGGGASRQDAQTGAGTYWPLTTGSTWTYRITDGTKPVFEKHVQVIGPAAVPGTSSSATQVRDVEPTLDELSWQVASDGVVVRVREEDRNGGNLLRTTTWSPAILKSIAGAFPLGWKREGSFNVSERLADGTLAEKVESFVWTVLAVDETVATPAGTFPHCLKLERVRTDKVKKPRTYWLAPGVGKVREEGERTEELVSYDVRE